MARARFVGGASGIRLGGSRECATLGLMGSFSIHTRTVPYTLQASSLMNYNRIILYTVICMAVEVGLVLWGLV